MTDVIQVRNDGTDDARIIRAIARGNAMLMQKKKEFFQNVVANSQEAELKEQM